MLKNNGNKDGHENNAWAKWEYQQYQKVLNRNNSVEKYSN